jgi:hypothetical protein
LGEGHHSAWHVLVRELEHPMQSDGPHPQVLVSIVLLALASPYKRTVEHLMTAISFIAASIPGLQLASQEIWIQLPNPTNGERRRSPVMFGHGQYVISLLPKYINSSEVRNPLRKTNLGQPSVRQLVVAMVEKASALGSLRVMIHGLLQVTWASGRQGQPPETYWPSGSSEPLPSSSWMCSVVKSPEATWTSLTNQSTMMD